MREAKGWAGTLRSAHTRGCPHGGWAGLALIAGCSRVHPSPTRLVRAGMTLRCPALPCAALRCPALRCPALPCPALLTVRLR